MTEKELREMPCQYPDCWHECGQCLKEKREDED